MPAYRFFLDAPLTRGESYELSAPEQGHIRVMRLHEGDEIELINGQGQLAMALLKKKGHVEVTSVQSTPRGKEVILCQAIPRLNRLDWIVEKGTELGMTHLWLFPGDKSEIKKIGKPRLERLRSLSIAALKQSGRLYLPEFEEKPPLHTWDAFPHPAYFGDLDPSTKTFTPDNQSICFLIGPEAGWSAKEEEKMRFLGAHGVRLGPHILRTDTASIVALSLIQLKGE